MDSDTRDEKLDDEKQTGSDLRGGKTLTALNSGYVDLALLCFRALG